MVVAVFQLYEFAIYAATLKRRDHVLSNTPFISVTSQTDSGFNSRQSS